MSANNLNLNPVHLGLGATTTVQPTFTGDMAWYESYGQRVAPDGFEGRLVTLHSFDGAWDVWEMHPNGTELVLCTAGSLELVQELDSGEVTTVLTVGEYAINEPGVWHTANNSGPCSAVFITAGVGTQHRPRATG